MIHLAPYAIVRVVIFFILGILLAVYNPLHEAVDQVQLFSGLLVALYLLLWTLLRKGNFAGFNIVLSLSGFLAFASLGYLNLISFDQTNLQHHISNFENVEAYTFNTLDDGEERAKTIRYVVNIQSVKDSFWQAATGTMFLYVSKDAPRLNYGDTYILPGMPRSPDPPMNPGEFNYKHFLTFQNIHHQQFVRDAPLLVAKATSSFSLTTLGFELSRWSRSVFKRYITNGQDRSIALALVLGIKDGLDNEIKNAYSASGAMHVLAVSGLHVGIIYIILSALLGKLQANIFGRWIFASLVLAILWMYALITGFSPSVLRAVTMFSFVIVAKAINRKSNIYNTLAASALLLLLFDPYLIMSVGFQLSFLAVFGIVFLQPSIYNLIFVNNYLLDKVWAITAVSIAAQLATFPLGLLYFHQFPTFFLLSNLVVIPAAFVILVLGILLLFTAWIPYLASAIGALLGLIISVVNHIVFWIDDIPISQIDNIYITTGQSWLILLLVFGTAIFWATKRTKLFYILFGIFLLFNFSIFNQAQANNEINTLTFYRISGHTAVEWIFNGKSSFWSDEQLLKDSEKLRFHVRPNRLRSGVSDLDIHSFRKSSVQGIELTHLAGRSILLLRDVRKEVNFNKKPKIDFLIYTADCRRDLEWVKDNFDFELLIIGGDLNFWKADRLVIQCKKLGLPHYSLYHKGALKYKI